ncbi:MAG: hypothetical protein PUF03_01320 [Lachnospiraceae bacterium]|nr:hypothetical protein [Lachnospiraceae bacterium]
MIYREKMIEDAQKWEKNLFANSIRVLEAEYGKAQRRSEVVQIFTELFRQWEINTRQKAASLGICYLHHNILMKTGKLRLTLYGTELYLDENQIENEWDLPFFFEKYEQDMAVLTDRIRADYPRVYAYEVDAIRYHYAEYYYAAIAGMCRDMLEEIKDSKEYHQLNKTEDFCFFFGRWRGEAQKL